MNLTSRIAILYSVPRSGSTYVEKAVGSYLETYYGHKALSELFNVNLIANFQEKQISVDTDNWHENIYQYSLALDEVKKIRYERLGWLDQTRSNYFLKLLEPQLSQPDMEELFITSDVFFCRRENLWEHLLSFLISMATHQFYSKDGLKWEPGTIRASLDLFLLFGTYIGRYRRMREAHQKNSEIVFEELLEKGSSYMASLGFDREFRWDEVGYPPKQNLRDKQLAFSNLDEIEDWYKQSFLNRIYPI
jgi:hypothetical protein